MFITSSRHSYELFKKKINFQTEELWIAALNSQLKLISVEMLFRGTVDHCPCHPRDIFRFLCLNNASAFIIAHNHPSGDHGPSRQDLKFTSELIKLSEIMRIALKDHLILSQIGYSSLADRGFLLKKSKLLRP